MPQIARRARPLTLLSEERALLAYVADEYAEGFVVDQFPEHQGGEYTGWDHRDILCLRAVAARLRRSSVPRMYFTDRERILLVIAGNLFCDEFLRRWPGFMASPPRKRSRGFAVPLTRWLTARIPRRCSPPRNVPERGFSRSTPAMSQSER